MARGVLDLRFFTTKHEKTHRTKPENNDTTEFLTSSHRPSIKCYQGIKGTGCTFCTSSSSFDKPAKSDREVTVKTTDTTLFT